MYIGEVSFIGFLSKMYVFLGHIDSRHAPFQDIQQSHTQQVSCVYIHICIYIQGEIYIHVSVYIYMHMHRGSLFRMYEYIYICICIGKSSCGAEGDLRFVAVCINFLRRVLWKKAFFFKLLTADIPLIRYTAETHSTVIICLCICIQRETHESYRCI